MNRIKYTLAKAIIKILNPIVRVLLNNEVSYSEFIELAKRSYVQVADKHFAIPNKRKTYSRTAVITGLSRKEVVRLSTLNEEDPPDTKGPLNRATQVVMGWTTDKKFLDTQNEPKILPLHGDQGSFKMLVAKYSGDIRARTILDELIYVKIVTQPDKNSVKLIQKSYIPKTNEIEKLNIFSQHITDHLNTMVHNISTDKKHTRFQRQVIFHDLSASVVQQFETYSAIKSMALLKDYNDWLAAHKEQNSLTPDEATYRIGVGIYLFKHKQNNED